MGVARDDDRHSVILRRHAGHVVEIQTHGMGIQLDHLALVGHCAKHGLEIDLERFATRDHSPGRMAQDRNVWVVQRVEHAAGDTIARLSLAIMHAGDDPIGFGQQIVGQIEPTLFEDVDLDALQHGNAAQPLVDLVDFGVLLSQLRLVEPAGHGDAFRVIGNGDVFQPTLLGGFGHGLDSGPTVGPGAVHVQIAADVGRFDQPGQLSGVGPVELAACFPQFRRDPRQLQRGVDVFLRMSGDRLFAAKDAVFVDLQPSILGPATDHDIVGLRAGEVL